MSIQKCIGYRAPGPIDAGKTRCSQDFRARRVVPFRILSAENHFRTTRAPQGFRTSHERLKNHKPRECAPASELPRPSAAPLSTSLRETAIFVTGRVVGLCEPVSLPKRQLACLALRSSARHRPPALIMIMEGGRRHASR